MTEPYTLYIKELAQNGHKNYGHHGPLAALGIRACSTNNCPIGIATQKESLRKRIIIDTSANQLYGNQRSYKSCGTCMWP
jgi:Conserved region in glutamate synthase